jgi:hypothetical protein
MITSPAGPMGRAGGLSSREDLLSSQDIASIVEFKRKEE